MMEAVAIPPFERFYGEHRDEVLGYLRRLLGQRAEDAWQETFLRALRAYDRLEHGRHLRAWVFTIATRVAMDELRGKRRVRSSRTSTASPCAELRRPAYRELEHLTGRPAAEGARRRRAALRLRPALRRDRRRARLVRGGGARRCVVRRPQTEEDLDDVTPELDARFRAAALAEGLVDVRYDVVDSPVGELFVAATAARALPDLVHASRAQDEELARAFGVRVLRVAARRGAPRARRVLRGPAARVRPAARPARRAVPRGGAARARPRPVRPHRHLRRTSRRRSGGRRPRARSAR